MWKCSDFEKKNLVSKYNKQIKQSWVGYVSRWFSSLAWIYQNFIKKTIKWINHEE